MKSHERHACSVGLCLFCCLIFFEFLAARDFIYTLHYYSLVRCLNLKIKICFPFKKKLAYNNPRNKQPSYLLHILNYDGHFGFCEIIPYDTTLFLGMS
jgi:hypothetical protein